MEGIALLYAPAGYWEMPQEVREARKTACGAGDGIGDAVVPEKIWGLNVTEACRIHDYMYEVGRTIEDKEEADRVLLNNILRLIDAAEGASKFPLLARLLAALRRYRAMTYYNAVRDFGGPAFWETKNSQETLSAVAV